MSERKDKKKVIGEAMTDDQIKAFLHALPETGEDADFHVLLRAYRSLREDDFQRFLGFFSAEGRNINARGLDDRTLLDIAASHRKSSSYIDALKAAGAH
ncbi:MAG: PA4642 family protein [Alcanivoracaceae bacterium]|nr:PA4642 family protein [Alcanivoracaceae bacterium]